jgi:hypothetical protein
MKIQGRFKHLFATENEWLLKKAQEDVDRNWERLLREEACVSTGQPVEEKIGANQ